MKKINKNKTVKTLQITGVEYVTPICEWNYLAEISCSHTKGKQKIYELYYLNKNNEIVAHFRHNVPFAAEQLHKDNERLFAVSIASEKYPHRIYRIEKNGTKKLLNMYNNMEFGIEDGCFAVQKDGLWGFIDADGNEIINPDYTFFKRLLPKFAYSKKTGNVNNVGITYKLKEYLEKDSPNMCRFLNTYKNENSVLPNGKYTA